MTTTLADRPSIPSSFSERQVPKPRVYDLKDLCRVLLLGKATIHRYKSCGRIPRPNKPGGKLLWDAAEIDEWIASGMPDQQTWEAMRKAKDGRR